MNSKMNDAARKVQRAKDYRAAQNLEPDWWVKELIIREKLTGLAPEPFLLRKDDAELDGRMKAETSESGVRQLLEEFNRRVVSARRQLLGGPPVVTRTRDIDVEIARWRDGKAPTGDARQVPDPAARPTGQLPPRQGRSNRRWWQRPGK